MSKSNTTNQQQEAAGTPAASAGAPAPRRRRRPTLKQQVADGIMLGDPETMGDLLYARCDGFMDMAAVTTFIALFGRFVEDLGREPQSLVELSEWVGPRPSRATLDRYQKRFRAAFPEYASPAVLWSQARPQVKGKNAAVVASQIGAVTL